MDNKKKTETEEINTNPSPSPPTEPININFHNQPKSPLKNLPVDQVPQNIFKKNFNFNSELPKHDTFQMEKNKDIANIIKQKLKSVSIQEPETSLKYSHIKPPPAKHTVSLDRAALKKNIKALEVEEKEKPTLIHDDSKLKVNYNKERRNSFPKIVDPKVIDDGSTKGLKIQAKKSDSFISKISKRDTLSKGNFLHQVKRELDSQLSDVTEPAAPHTAPSLAQLSEDMNDFFEEEEIV